MGDTLYCTVVQSREDMDAAFNIRRRVFMVEQGVPESIEMDELDASALHMLCRVGGGIVATGRLNIFGREAKMGRVAVLQELRGRGIGSRVVEFLLEEARRRGVGVVYANVQVHSKEFYAKHGFREVGEVFLEAGIEHIRMEKALKDGIEHIRMEKTLEDGIEHIRMEKTLEDGQQRYG